MIIIWLIYVECLQNIVKIIINIKIIHYFILILCNIIVIYIIYYIYIVYRQKINIKLLFLTMLLIIEATILLLILVMLFYKNKKVMINIYILMFVIYYLYWKHIINISNIEMFFRIIIIILFIWYFSWWLNLDYLDKKFYIYTFFKYLMIFIHLTEFKEFNKIIIRIIAWIYPEDFY